MVRNYIKKNILCKYKQLKNKKIGKLKVLYDTGKRSKKWGTFWKCRCECGKIVDIDSGYLLKSNYADSKKGCGCGKHKTGNKTSRWSGYGCISGQYWAWVNRHAKDRNLKLEIDIKYAWKIFIKQKGFCALSGLKLTFNHKKDGTLINGQTASLDRIDSKKGYIKGNIQWLHKDINKIKWNYSEDYFIKMCQNVVHYQNILSTDDYII